MRTVPFDETEKCDNCGKDGAFDFMGDFICGECIKKEEVIKKEYEDKFSGCYDDDTECVTIDNSTLWLWIEQKIKEAKIEENERWLAHANRFSDDVPLHLKKINRSELKDRIKELKEIL